MPATRGLSWERDGRYWPNRASSVFIRAANLSWHVQRMGNGPPILLLHGTGSSTHSWRALAPLLASRFTVVAPDLPGHGFTETPVEDGLSLPGMAREIADLLTVLAFDPAMIVGHSAGAAIMTRMTLDGTVAPRALVSLNGALLPFRGFARSFFSPLAKLLVLNPLVPRLFAWRASDRVAVERLIRNTGSEIDKEGVDLYRRLVSSHRHVSAALAMIANWDLDPLFRDLGKLKVPVLLVAGGDDWAISSEQAFRVQKRVPSAKVEYMRGVGHLAHEERPEEIASIIEQFAASSDVFAGA
jgi:magnesium chelatase accessory protein